MLSLMAVVATVGALVLLGCPGDKDHDNPATASDLNNRSFTFSSGKAFNSALTNVSTAVSFSNNATNFALQARYKTLRARHRIYGLDSCLFTVGNSTNPTAPTGGSDFPAGQGRNPTRPLTCPSVDFDSTNNSLTVFDGTATITGVSRL